MSKRATSTPQLDWTFGPAPSADETPPSPAPRQPRPNPAAALRLSRRTWLLLGALAGMALALTVALPAWQLARTRRAVEQVVAQQEQARLAEDWDGLSATYAGDSVGWALTRASRLRNGWLPTPISLPGLRSDGQPGRVSRFQVLGPMSARAEVTRGFILANGTHVTFAMPQYYQFAQGQWRQAPPPEVPRDQAQRFHGARVDVTYYPDDADWAPSLASQLDDLLTRACADWACPPEVRVAVAFDPSDPASAATSAAYDSLLGSLTLQIILGRPSAYPVDTVNLATRVTGGYPADAAAAEAVRRAAGVRALIRVAQQLAPSILLHGENAYLDALIAREAARLGIDEPGLAQLQIANPLFAPDELWSVPQLHFSSAGALAEALVILNRILAERDITDEQHLMHGLNAPGNVITWLGDGLGLGYVNVQKLLYPGFDVPFPTVLPAGFTPDFALSCRAGPLLGTLGGQVAPLLDGNLPDSSVDVWSPDGQRLALHVSGRLSLVDLAGRSGRFLPQASFQAEMPPAWASNTVLVYPDLEGGLGPPGNSTLVYFGAGDPGSFENLPNFDTFLPSPDGKWAAIQGQPNGSEPLLAIVSAQPGLTLFNAVFGYNPAWSADSQHLAFVLRDPSSSSLVVFDMASRDKRTIWTSSDPGVPVVPNSRGVDATSLLAGWDPGGDRLALAAVTDTGSGYAGWVGLLRPDGTDFRLLPAGHANLAPDSVAYSADGRYLAVDLFDASGARGVALYSADGALLRWLPGFGLDAWAPAGHALALTGLEGVSLLSEPQSKPEMIGPAGCTGLAWKP